jgi:hypothetical protein
MGKLYLTGRVISTSGINFVNCEFGAEVEDTPFGGD